MIIYIVFYGECPYTECPEIISIHQHKINAYRAMLKHKHDKAMEWIDNRILYGKKSESHKYDNDKHWWVNKYKLEL